MWLVLLTVLLLAPTALAQFEVGDNKIVGGSDAERGEFPFMVSIQKGSHHMCGGSLISTMLVLTAAHCVIDMFKYKAGDGKNGPMKAIDDLTLMAGTTDVISPQRTQQTRQVRSSQYHPEAQKLTTGWIYDVGIMEAGKAFTLTPESVETIALPTGVDIVKLAKQKVQCQAIGWGATIHQGQATKYLQKVTLTLTPQPTCEKLIQEAASRATSSSRFDKRVQICTLGTEGEDACTGDSGGPLLCSTEGRQRMKLEARSGNERKSDPPYILVGTCSWGLGCGDHNVPGVWARVDVALNWIDRILKDERTIEDANNRNVHSTIVLCACTVISLWCLQ